MSHSADVKQSIRQSFISGVNLKQASADANISYQTVRTWKIKALQDGDDWDKLRAAYRMSAGGMKAMGQEVLESFALMFVRAIADLERAENIDPLDRAEAIARLSDAYTKTMKAASIGNNEISALGIAMDVLKHQVEFIKKKHPKLLTSFMQILEPFAKELGRVYG